MKVLLACEESQTVCKAFREKGHEAFSCDVQPCSGGHPEWHIRGDVREVLGNYWDLIIAFPPCTYLSNAGAARLYPKKGEINKERYEKGLVGKEFFMLFYNANCDHVAIENPIASSVFRLPEYSQVIQPWQFGHPYQKKTCLWLKGLPLLKPTKVIPGKHLSWVSGGSKRGDGTARGNKGETFRDSKTKSKTFTGIAEAMADQWGSL